MMEISTGRERHKLPKAEERVVERQADHYPAIACDMTAIPIEDRELHQSRADYIIFEAVEEIREVSDGYAFRFAADDYETITTFIASERLCCPFFNFVLEVTPAGGPLWLRLTGGEGVKQFLHALLNQ